MAPRTGSETMSKSTAQNGQDLKLRSKVVGPLPLLNRFLERLQIERLLERHVPAGDRRQKLSPAVGLGVLLRNIMLSRRPLYGLAEWAGRFEAALLGLPQDSAQFFNDDRVGRCLDALFVADRATLMTEIVVHAVQEFKLQTGTIGAEYGGGPPVDPVDALARAILYQQLSGKAAATIVARVEAAIGATRLHCDTLGRVDDPTLRACGVSGNKALALRDLARREQAGEIPTLRRMSTMGQDDIIAALVPIRGIGRWTVQMMLMFRLGRPDVLPVDDLGIRKGVQVVDGLEEMPKPRELMQRGEGWAPWRTAASLYLWRIADLSSGAKGPVKRSQE